MFSLVSGPRNVLFLMASELFVFCRLDRKTNLSTSWMGGY